MTDLTAETEATSQCIADRVAALAQDITEIKVGVERLTQAIVGDNGDEALAARSALRKERLRKRQATIASGGAGTPIEDAALKPAQTKMVEQWKFRAAVAIAVVSTFMAIATALMFK